MNHGPEFWAYYRRLKREVYALQRAKYFGDGQDLSLPLPLYTWTDKSLLDIGFWSSGQVLQDGAREERVREVEDLPEYLVKTSYFWSRMISHAS
jgi:hypothetical protein